MGAVINTRKREGSRVSGSTLKENVYGRENTGVTNEITKGKIILKKTTIFVLSCMS